MMPLPGMTTEAAYAMNLEWGDSALANFFGTQASADAADPVNFSFIQLNRAPETLRSHFVTDAQTSYYRQDPQTSKRFGLGTVQPSPDRSPGDDLLSSMQDTKPHHWKWLAFAVIALAVWYGVRRG